MTNRLIADADESLIERMNRTTPAMIAANERSLIGPTNLKRVTKSPIANAAARTRMSIFSQGLSPPALLFCAGR